MENKTLYELGVLVKGGDTLAMLEIINRKRYMLKTFSYNDEDLYQYLVLKLIESIKKYNF